jgi:hypothetical protein
MAEMRLAAL